MSKNYIKFQELLSKLNNLTGFQHSGDWAEDLPEEIWEDDFQNNFKEIISGLFAENHRWYETSVSVIKIYGYLLGIKSITNMFSENQDYEDCCEKIKFYEMEEIQITSYRAKKGHVT